MKVEYFFAIVLCIFLNVLSANAQKHTLSGRVIDAGSGEPILYVACVNENSGHGTTSNDYGYFSLFVESEVQLRFSCIGYEPSRMSLSVVSDTSIVICMIPKSKSLDEVVVSTVVPEREQVHMGKNTMSVELLRSIPSFCGEADLMKSISYLPGVSLGKEGYSNIYVRGGDRGQNLILLDGIKVYNTSHLGGFLSLFNSDIVKHVDVYKGGFPAQYGGRASSVIDVVTKDGNSEHFAGKASLGLLASSLMIESPIGKNLSFYVAGRTSYYALFCMADRREFYDKNEGEYTNFTVFDINGKLKWRMTPSAGLSLCVFMGNDYQTFGEAEKSKNETKPNDGFFNKDRMQIRNRGISLTHVQNFGSLFWRNTFSISKYDNSFHTLSDETLNNYRQLEEVKTESSIKDATLQSRVEINRGVSLVKAGVELSRYVFRPIMTSSHRDHESTDVSCDTIQGYTEAIKSTEASIYANDELELTDMLSADVGVRFSLYSCDNTRYYRVEPRFSMRYLICDNLSAKVNYSTMNQFNHVLVNVVQGFEKEIWLAATEKLKPQHSNMFSVGLFFGQEEYKISASVEGFYKTMSNLIAYRMPVDEGKTVASIENRVQCDGMGRSCGMELMIAKDFHKVSINTSYTFSRNDRKFSQINAGKWYPYLYDRRHDISILASLRINHKLTLNGNFTLSSGIPVTLPVGYVKQDNLFGDYYVYDGINNRRLPLYHRLDLAASYVLPSKHGHHHELKFNLFNAYAHQNAQSIYYDSWSGNVRQIAMFSIVPSITYTFTF